MPIISSDIWITREGQQVEISKMPSSHLLATIHFIERKRFEACFEVYQDAVNNGITPGMLEYYSQWPLQYETLVAEAQKRGLIGRITPKENSTRETSLEKRTHNSVSTVSRKTKG